jgi:hypothetical protein
MINVGTIDRTVRIIVGLVLLAAVFVPPLSGMFEAWGNWKYLVTAVGVVLLVTGAVRVCPAYSVLGMNTCERT